MLDKTDLASIAELLKPLANKVDSLEGRIADMSLDVDYLKTKLFDVNINLSRLKNELDDLRRDNREIKHLLTGDKSKSDNINANDDEDDKTD